MFQKLLSENEIILKAVVAVKKKSFKKLLEAMQTGLDATGVGISPQHFSVVRSRFQKLFCDRCSLSLWRVVRGSKLMHLDHLIHGLFIT